MRSSFYYHFTITVIFSLLLVALGIFWVILPSAPEFKQDIITFLESNSSMIQFSGICIAVLGIILLISSFFVTRREHHLVIFEKKGPVEISEDILQQYVNSYFSTLFPHAPFNVEAAIKKGKIHLVLDLPETDIDSQKILLESIESDLGKIFHQKLGYKEDFHLSVGFS
jgi:hypothetical protein